MKIALFISVLFIAIGCDNNQYVFDSEEEFESFVSNNETDFIISQKTTDFYFESMMIPPIEDDTLRQTLFRLRIGLNDGGNVLDFQDGGNYSPLEKEGYLSFEINNDVFLQYEGKKNIPVLHHYERNYGIKPTIDLVFYFNNIDSKEDVVLCYRDQLFGQGLIKLKFNKQLFTNCYVKK